MRAQKILGIFFLFCILTNSVSALGVSPGNLSADIQAHRSSELLFRVFSPEPFDVQLDINPGWLVSKEYQQTPGEWSLVRIKIRVEKPGAFQDRIIIQTKKGSFDASAVIGLQLNVSESASPVIGVAIIIFIVAFGLFLVLAIQRFKNNYPIPLLKR